MEKLNFRLLFLITIAWVALAFSSCNSSPDVIVQKQVYLCCNLWNNGDLNILDNSEETIEQIELEITQFLIDNEINPLNVNVANYGEEVLCIHCCECPAGLYAFVSLDDEDQQAALDLGFD